MHLSAFKKLHNLKPDSKKALSLKGLTVALLVVTLFTSTLLIQVQKAQAALLTASSIQLSDSRTSQTAVTYTVAFTFPSTTSIQCIKIPFGTTSALSTPPTGMTTASGFTLSGGGLTQGSWTNYSGTAGTLEIYNAAGQASTATSITIAFTGVTNTSTSGVFYAQVQTYTTQATSGATCSGAADTSNVMALTTTTGVAASVSVDPSVTFSLVNYGSAVNGSAATGITTTSSTIPFGPATAGTAILGSHTATVSTNAAGGYILYTRYTGALTNGVQTIADATGTNASPTAFNGSSSTSAFGYITDNAQETSRFTSNTWAKFTTTNLEVAKSTSAVNADASHIGYQVVVSNTQQPGTYTTTIIYTVTPTY